MSKEIVAETALMSYKVEQVEEEYIIKVTVHGKSVNEWTLGTNEEIAQSKAKTLVDTYMNGLEYVQEQVRNVFAEQENSTEAHPSSEATD